MEFLITATPDLAVSWIAHVFERPPMRDTCAAALGYGVIGLAIGWISLLVFPDSFIASPGLRLVNLFLSPVAAGGVMCSLGGYREGKGLDVARVDSFLFGFLLALGVAAVRYVYAIH